MRPITTAELERGRAAFADTLPEVADRLEYARVRVPGAAERDTWTAAGALRCSRSDPTRAELNVMAEQYGPNARAVVTVEQAAPVALRDRLRFADGQTLEVVGQLTGAGPWAMGARLAVAEVHRGQ